MEDDKRNYIAQMAKIQDDLLSAEAALAERRAALSALEKTVSPKPVEKGVEPEVPAEKANRYRSVCADLEGLLKHKRELLLHFTEEHPLVKHLGRQISETEAQKKQIELEHPEFLKLPVLAAAVNSGAIDLVAEASRVNALSAKIVVLKAQLAKVRTEATRVVEAEPSITQLQRTKELQEG